jgi:uncharacterized membrane protein
VDDLGTLLLFLFFAAYSIIAALVKRFRRPDRAGRRLGTPEPPQVRTELQEQPAAPPVPEPESAPPMLEPASLWEQIRREMAEAEAPPQPSEPVPTMAEPEEPAPIREPPPSDSPAPPAASRRPMRRHASVRLSPRTLGEGIILATVLGRPRGLADRTDLDPE